MCVSYIRVFVIVTNVSDLNVCYKAEYKICNFNVRLCDCDERVPQIIQAALLSTVGFRRT